VDSAMNMDMDMHVDMGALVRENHLDVAVDVEVLGQERHRDEQTDATRSGTCRTSS
jgi:hypothetical protein